jgi:anti-sigma factor RsiW
VIEFLMDYLHNELPEDQRARFADHLADCAPCRAYLCTYQEAVQMGRQCLCSADSPLQHVPEELVQAILAARAKST